MTIVTNLPRFPREWSLDSGEHGKAVHATSLAEFLRGAQHREAILLVNCDPGLVRQLALLFWLIPWKRRPLISVDLVLRRPASMTSKILNPVWRWLYSRVDHHIHYFRDLREYEKLFGIGRHNSSYVPFKPNISRRTDLDESSEGDYVLCFGHSLRDYDTFFTAIEALGYPGAIASPDQAALIAHGARFTRSISELPANVSILPDEGTENSQIEILKNAKLVVLPVLRSSMAASGISTCLNALLLGKCVIGSKGPGMGDVFTDEVLLVPPEDAEALAAVIRQAWEDDELRRRTAAAGRRYAVALGGEPELYKRILLNTVEWHRLRR